MRATKGHGRSRTPIYFTWQSMVRRCTKPTHQAWSNYGGRGIGVCERWLKFENFYADMGDAPKGMALDRINNDGDYEPSNCRWATVTQNSRNRRTNRLITFRGERKCVAEWAEQLGMKHSALTMRLESGWSVEEALTTPLVPKTISRTWRARTEGMP